MSKTDKEKPQRGPLGGRVKHKRPNAYFAKLAQTEEGRAQLKEWQSRSKPKGKTPGAINGMTKLMRTRMIAKAEAEAKEIVAYMETKGTFIPKDTYAKEAMEAVVAQVRMEQIPLKDKLAAARTVLEWTMAKPATETNVSVKKAEDFLADLMTEMGN